MSRLSFSTIVSTVKDISNVKGKDSLIKRGVQASLDRVSSKWTWPHLMDESFFTTVAPYTTGSIAVTNGSTAVVGTGTTFTAAMVDRKLRVSGEDAYYRIASWTDATHITLETPYGGDTATGQEYSIFKDEYRLAPDCDRYKILKHIEDSKSLVGMHPSAFDMVAPTPSSEGTPNFEIFAGTKIDIYDTGTISATVNTSVLTGAGTSWLSVEGLGRGSRIKTSTQIFTVKSVDTDTQITVYEIVTLAIAALTAYEILLDNLIIQLYEIPDAAENVYYRYQRVPAPLVGDMDIPDMPDNWFWLLVEGGLIWAWATKKGNKSNKQILIFEAGINDMKKQLGYPSEHQSFPRRSMDRYTYPNAPLLPGTYGTVIPYR